jgi:hypothetical protein
MKLDSRLTYDEQEAVYKMLTTHGVMIPRDTCARLTVREIMTGFGSRSEGQRRARVRQLIEEALGVSIGALFARDLFLKVSLPKLFAGAVDPRE